MREVKELDSTGDAACSEALLFMDGVVQLTLIEEASLSWPSAQRCVSHISSPLQVEQQFQRDLFEAQRMSAESLHVTDGQWQCEPPAPVQHEVNRAEEPCPAH